MDIQKNLLRGILLLTAIIGIYLYLKMDKEAHLRKNLKKAVAKISKTELYYNKGKQCRLSLIFGENSKYSLDKSILSKCDCNSYKGKFCMIVYDSSDIENSHLLTNDLDYYKYDLSVPDSLAWIQNCQ